MTQLRPCQFLRVVLVRFREIRTNLIEKTPCIVALGIHNRPVQRPQPQPSQAIKTLNLVKGREQFCFRYEVGQESKVLESLIDMVKRRELTIQESAADLWIRAAEPEE